MDRIKELPDGQEPERGVSSPVAKAASKCREALHMIGREYGFTRLDCTESGPTDTTKGDR